MLIVEGPDGAGKSTLLNEFATELGVEPMPRVVSKDTEALTDLRQWVDDDLARGFGLRLYDRHRMVSEPIYGPIMRDHQEPGFNDLYWMVPRMQRFYEIRPIIIYCLPPLATVQDNLADDEDNSSVVNHIRAIYSAYVSRIAIDTMINPNIFVWDYTAHDSKRPPWFNTVIRAITEDSTYVR